MLQAFVVVLVRCVVRSLIRSGLWVLGCHLLLLSAVGAFLLLLGALCLGALGMRRSLRYIHRKSLLVGLWMLSAAFEAPSLEELR